MMVKEIERGLGRGYVREEGGGLSIVDIPIIDGQAVDSWGIPYKLTDELVELKGWPDEKASVVSSRFMIAVE
jgi:hypothetical protein